MSLARMIAAELAERSAFERALHDGVQQELIAFTLRLQLLRPLLSSNSAALQLVDELEGDVRDALERVRAQANEIYPSVLDSRGLADALQALLRSRAPEARFTCLDPKRYPPDVERVAYFACRALLTGADAKSELELSETNGVVRIDVRGYADSGVPAARDLVETVGGSLTTGNAADGRDCLVAEISLAPRPDRG